jgi:peroxiredoxin
VLAPGDSVPDVTLFGTDVEPVRLREFASEGPLLLAFYLYDWTGT